MGVVGREGEREAGWIVEHFGWVYFRYLVENGMAFVVDVGNGGLMARIGIGGKIVDHRP